MAYVYLDHQASTPVLPEVFEAMRPFFTARFGNPSSLHRLGMDARDALAASREQLAALVHAESPEEILFTSGGTEAANLAVKGVAYAGRRKGNHIVCSDIEHPAVLNSIEFLEKEGFTASRVKVDARGWVDPAAVRAALTEKTILLCVHHVNHDIGTIEPIREIGQLASERGIPFFVDAVASGGWLPIDVQVLGATLLSLAPHRFYGPKGVGVLYRSRRARLSGVQHGGVQEGGRRAGTENMAGIVGAGLAAEIAARQLSRRIASTTQLQKRLWEGLKQIPYCRLNGPELGPDRLSTNLNISFEFIEGEGVALMADVQGLALASGASCVSKALKVSPVLKAIGLDHALAQGNILLSLGQENTEQEIEFAIRTLTGIVAKLRGMSPLWDEFQRGAIESVIQPRSAPGPKRNVPSQKSSI
jgi:cysteine desulfurase